MLSDAAREAAKYHARKLECLVNDLQGGKQSMLLNAITFLRYLYESERDQ